MKSSALKRNLFIGTILVGAAASTSVFAQDAQAPQEIVVTGSRIAQPNLTSISPVTSVSSAEVKLEGTQRVEDLLNNLPEVFAAQGSNVANGSNGTATVDLRGLGANRTLVLVDGRRLLPGDPGAPAPDLNNIPAQLIDRIEIDTGGASAVYGSDAVAGVVNFILKKNFVGVQLDVQAGIYQDDNGDNKLHAVTQAAGDKYPSGSIFDGSNEQVNLLLGVAAPDGKGHLEAYATYRNVEAVLEGDRDYTACTLAEVGNFFGCGGSSTTSPPRLALVSTNGNPAATGKAGSSYTTVGTGPTTTLAPYVSADAFNYGPYNYLQRPDTRYNMGAIGDYQISPMADVYTEFMFMDDNSVAQIAPGGIFYGTKFTIPCANQFLTPAELGTFCGGSTAGNFVIEPGKRNVEGGGRQSDFRHTSYRFVIGLKGDLDQTWSYDGYLQYGTTIEQTDTLNYFSTNRIANALSGCTGTTLGTCVPYDLFQGGGATVTPAQLNYIQVPGITGGQTVEQIASMSVNGKLGNYGVKSPFAEDGVSIALGTEYRRENISEYADAEQEAGDLSGSGGAFLPIGGSFDVYELFGEAYVPLAKDKPFVYSANLDIAYRYSDYSTAGQANTYAFQGDWSPVKDLRFRASAQRAVRAPNILELFSPQNVTLANYVDPCAGTTPSYTLAQCMRTGMTAAQYGNALNVGSSANQNNQLTGGNTQLKPEVADTYSTGFVIQPHQIPGLSLAVDYFNIFVANVVQAGVASPTTVLSECALQNVAYYCGLIHRDAGSFGSLGATNAGYIVATNTNAGSLQTSGVDFDASYRTSLSKFGLNGWGSVTVNFTGTYLASLITESLPQSGQKYDCAGYYGQQCGTPNPTWRSQLRLSWRTPIEGLEVSGRWRYFGSVAVDLLNPSPLLAGSLVSNGAVPDAHLDAQNYFDLTLQYRLFDKYQLRFGVNNVFDKRPPVVGADECPTGSCNGNVYAQSYDSLGRNLFIGITANY